MRGFQERLKDFDARGIRVVAISVDRPEESRTLCAQRGYTFTFLSDQQREATRSYDLLHRGAGEGGTDIDRPAEFLIDASGTVRWVNLTESILVRARPERVLKVIDELGRRS